MCTFVIFFLSFPFLCFYLMDGLFGCAGYIKCSLSSRDFTVVLGQSIHEFLISTCPHM